MALCEFGFSFDLAPSTLSTGPWLYATTYIYLSYYHYIFIINIQSVKEMSELKKPSNT